jgi:hypothetical protein
MHRAILTLTVLLSLSALVCAQGVKVDVFPDPVPTGQPVSFILTNGSNGPIVIHPSGIEIISPDGDISRIPGADPGDVVEAGGAKLVRWDQTHSGRLAPPGDHIARFTFSDAAGNVVTVKNAFRITNDRLTVSGDPLPGLELRLRIDSPRAAGTRYQLACSFSTDPGIALPGNRLLGLAPDTLFFLSVFVGQGIFHDFSGALDSDGQADASVSIPDLPELLGVRIHAAYVTFIPSDGSFLTYSAPVGFTIGDVPTDA